MTSKATSSEEELTRLCEYAIELELSGKVCVFISMSGHVNWLNIKIVESEDKYPNTFGSWTISYDTDYSGKKIPTSVIKKKVASIISEIKQVVYDLELEKAKLAEEQLELQKLEELKAKYEQPNLKEKS